MAFINQLESIHQMFTSEAMRTLLDYLKEASTQESQIHKRILATNLESKYELGAGMIAIEQSYELKAESSAFFESHKKFVDFQLVVQGSELFYIANSDKCSIHTPYNDQKDLIIYNTPQCHSILHLQANTLAIFMPNDVHAGGLGLGSLPCDRLYKSGIKVPIALINLHF